MTQLMMSLESFAIRATYMRWLRRVLIISSDVDESTRTSCLNVTDTIQQDIQDCGDI